MEYIEYKDNSKALFRYLCREIPEIEKEIDTTIALDIDGKKVFTFWKNIKLDGCKVYDTIIAIVIFVPGIGGPDKNCIINQYTVYVFGTIANDMVGLMQHSFAPNSAKIDFIAHAIEIGLRRYAMALKYNNDCGGIHSGLQVTKNTRLITVDDLREAGIETQTYFDKKGQVVPNQGKDCAFYEIMVKCLNIINLQCDAFRGTEVGIEAINRVIHKWVNERKDVRLTDFSITSVNKPEQVVPIYNGSYTFLDKNTRTYFYLNYDITTNEIIPEVSIQTMYVDPIDGQKITNVRGKEGADFCLDFLLTSDKETDAIINLTICTYLTKTLEAIRSIK